MSQLYKIEAGTAQHRGDCTEQQDRVALFAALKARGYMMAVLADGMGELSSGGDAAEQVIRTARQNFERFSPSTDRVEALLEVIARDAHIIIKLGKDPKKNEPLSTIVALVITPAGSAVWAHVGDSRLYRFDGPNCIERTKDHSYIEKMVGKDNPIKNGARTHHLSNVLVNVLGMERNDLIVTIKRFDGLKVGDSFLLCSDGLWHYFNDSELGAAIAMNSPRAASEMLIQKARERATGFVGDNCSMAIIKLAPPPEEIKDYTVHKMDNIV